MKPRKTTAPGPASDPLRLDLPPPRNPFALPARQRRAGSHADRRRATAPDDERDLLQRLREAGL
ncbi:MAG: hypothetical protein RL722_2320 [Pseudomonadota bacterium]|jgi:hypothetical protein